MAAPASRNTLVSVLSLLMAALVVAGCTAPTPGPTGPVGTTTAGMSGTATSATDDGDGTVAVRVKDGPADEFTNVFLSFCLVQVHRAGGDGDAPTTTAPASSATSAPTNGTDATAPSGTTTPTTNATAGTSTTTATAGTTGTSVGPVSPTSGPTGDCSPQNEASGWLTVFSGNTTIDIKAFSGNASAFLGAEGLDPGHYTQIRLGVADAYGILASDGSRKDIRVPSGELKLVGQFELEDDELIELVVDIDLNQSLTRAGPNWNFRPVAKLNITEGGDEGDLATMTTTPTTAAPTASMTATPTNQTTATSGTTTSTPANGPQGTR